LAGPDWQAPPSACLLAAVRSRSRISVALYALAGGQAYARSDEFQHLLALHDDMLIAYRARNFVAAKQMTADAAQCAPAEVIGLYH
jgi:hypothetical protein